MSTSVPVSAAEFLARFHETKPVALNYRAPTDLFNDLELDALVASFGPTLQTDPARQASAGFADSCKELDMYLPPPVAHAPRTDTPEGAGLPISNSSAPTHAAAESVCMRSASPPPREPSVGNLSSR